VKQAGFYVLNGVYMPSVLIELAYLSNAKDRSRISNDAYLKKMVRYLSEGLTEYINTYNARVSG
jgi:N-acetylmuramoyl-L-alanine amidase